MEYRKFGSLDWRPSALGFGCMRLPTLDSKAFGSRIRKREAIRMIRHAVDHGVNYLDTAYGYHGGKSEGLVREALKEGYADRVRVATKSPVWLIGKPDDFDKYLDTQLKRLGTKHVDFYLLHGLNKRLWQDKVLKHKVLKRAEAARKDGRIGHLGFSFHDSYSVFKEIVDGHDDWDFCQIQYNYMDIKNQAGVKGLKYAARKRLGVVVMEPLLGGKLANPPKEIGLLIQKRGRGRSPVDLALQWIWSQPEVSLVLSGMSTMAQVRHNLRSAEASELGRMTARDLQLIDRLRQEYAKRTPIACTKCAYCMPCPNGVDIPENFELYNDGVMHEDLSTARMMYARFMSKKSRASACKKCGKCEEKCPQGLNISELMTEVHSKLG